MMCLNESKDVYTWYKDLFEALCIAIISSKLLRESPMYQSDNNSLENWSD